MKIIFKFIKYSLITIVGLVALFVFLIYIDVIWKSPPYFEVTDKHEFLVPIMDMAAYDTLGNHVRPYIYNVSGASGSVYVVGIDHTLDKNDPQIDSIQRIWESFQPSIALVEGRLGFLLYPLQNPVQELGEGGETMRLAKKDNVPIYTWEPRREDEIKLLLQKYTPKQVALFYSLRPYFSNMRFGRPEEPDEKMLEYINSRTDFDGIRNEITGIQQVDSMWQADYPSEVDWRDMTDEYGYLDGYLSEIANMSNLARDIHMCYIIVNQVKSGNKVFITMGSSHAFRIEETIKAELK